MASRFLHGAAVAAAVLTAGALAGCGSSAPSSGESAGQVMSALHSSVKTATSVHMSGTVTQGAEKLSMDISFDGSNLYGTMGENGSSFVVLALNGKTYIKLDAAFLKVAGAPTATCTAICGKYVQLPASDASQITGQFTLPNMANAMFSSSVAAKAKKSGDKFTPTTVDGQHVLQFRQGNNALDVANIGGTLYPVLFIGPDGDRITFTDWNSVTLPGAPPASEVVALNKI
jgi:hypothetical protein